MINEMTLKCFVSLAKTLNFASTARELDITQQSVSQNISKLEKDLGFLLFQRDKWHTNLTPEGEKYQDFIEEFMRREKVLRNECLTNIKNETHRLNLGFQDWTNLGPAVNYSFALLREKYPDIEINFVRKQPGLLLQSFFDGDLDMVVIYGRWAPRQYGINVAELQKADHLILVAYDNPLATETATYKAFISEPYIADNYGWESYSDTKERMKHELEYLGFKPERLVVTQDREAAYTAAELGQGCVLATEMNRVLGNGPLVGYHTGLKETLVCVWNANTNEIADHYADCLVRAYQEKPFRLPTAAQHRIR